MITVVLGTRPELIKLAPICNVLASRQVQHRVLAIGQQAHLLQKHLAETGLSADVAPIDRTSDTGLDILLGQAIAAVSMHLRQHDADVVVVQGDTTTALAGALAAWYRGAVVAHVEAGLRTYSEWPYPEEGNRRLISQIATLHFAPTPHASQNLHRERVLGRVAITGNTGIDAFRNACRNLRRTLSDDYALVTVHRRENWPRIRLIAEAVRACANERLKILWSVHPNPLISRAVEAVVRDHPDIIILQPVRHETMAQLVATAAVVITDSGGLIEEAADAERPCLILRDVTERPEALDGACQLVRDISTLPELVSSFLGRVRTSKGTFGDGRAAERIVDVLTRAKP